MCERERQQIFDTPFRSPCLFPSDLFLKRDILLEHFTQFYGWCGETSGFHDEGRVGALSTPRCSIQPHDLTWYHYGLRRATFDQPSPSTLKRLTSLRFHSRDIWLEILRVLVGTDFLLLLLCCRARCKGSVRGRERPSVRGDTFSTTRRLKRRRRVRSRPGVVFDCGVGGVGGGCGEKGSSSRTASSRCCCAQTRKGGGRHRRGGNLSWRTAGRGRSVSPLTHNPI